MPGAESESESEPRIQVQVQVNERLIRYLRDGQSLREIAKQLELSLDVVRYIAQSPVTQLALALEGEMD